MQNITLDLTDGEPSNKFSFFSLWHFVEFWFGWYTNTDNLNFSWINDKFIKSSLKEHRWRWKVCPNHGFKLNVNV